jgi:hypothetical protein
MAVCQHEQAHAGEIAGRGLQAATGDLVAGLAE